MTTRRVISWYSKKEPLPAELATLCQRASEFELVALLKALLARGIGFESMRFEGIGELHYTPGPVVRELRFEPGTPPTATIGLDAGLLSLSAPLPEYFRDFARRLPDADAFVHFMGFWDSVLLRDLAYCALPVRMNGEPGGGSNARLARLNIDCPTTLHWIFRGAFPELTARVEHATFPRGQLTPRMRIGAGMTGRTVLGGSYTDQTAGFRVVLTVDQDRCECVRDWEEEGARRLERIDSVLLRMRRPLEVVLRFDEYRHGQALSQGEDPRQLGVRPWLMTERGRIYGPGAVRLRTAWSG